MAPKIEVAADWAQFRFPKKISREGAKAQRVAKKN
jgi:hypothetical protein